MKSSHMVLCGVLVVATVIPLSSGAGAVAFRSAG